MTSSIVTVGRFASPYGIQGWIKVRSFTSPIQNILKYQPWKIHLINPDRWEDFPIKASRFSSNHLVVQIEGCTTPEEARRYTGLEIGINTQQLPPLPMGEYYWSQLIGLNVITTEGVDLGVVEDLLETGSNDVLIIKGERSRMVPYLLNKVIQSIDLDKKTIIVDWDPEF